MTREGDRTVQLIVPEGVDDPDRVSGGNVFDVRLAEALTEEGWVVRMSESGADDGQDVAPLLARLPDASLVLVDGLVACRAPAALEGEAERLQIVVIAHMVAAAFADADAMTIEAERRALGAAQRVIATSEWCRTELVRSAAVGARRVVVATPGSDEAPVAEGTPDGTSLLCVGVVAPHKGQDTLVDALAALDRETHWSCTIAGSLTSEADFAAGVAQRVADAGIGDRVTLAGVLAADDLADAYRRADLLVAPSRVESYGMAVADALRRGIPVVASTAGGLPQTVAHRAAILVPSGRASALRDALGRWMADPALRRRLKADAVRGRGSLPGWRDTAAIVASALEGLR